MNKFNLSWQLTRVKARKIKDVDKKIDFVLFYLENNKNCHNLDRVSNWLRMTSLAYSNRSAFNKALQYIEDTKYNYLSTDDNIVNVDNVSKEDILMVLKDLNKRKYNFRFNGKIPEDHKRFVEDLTSHLNCR
jgi:hypothetical protein